MRPFLPLSKHAVEWIEDDVPSPSVVSSASAVEQTLEPLHRFARVIRIAVTVMKRSVLVVALGRVESIAGTDGKLRRREATSAALERHDAILFVSTVLDLTAEVLVPCLGHRVGPRIMVAANGGCHVDTVDFLGLLERLVER